MRTREHISVSLPPAMLKEAEKARKQEHRTMSELMREALRHYLRRQALSGAQVDELLLEGLRSPARPLNKKWLSALKAEVQKTPRRRRA